MHDSVAAPPPSRAARDATLAVAITVLGGLSFVGLDVMERLGPTLSSLERLELDDLLLTLMLALAATVWFAARRVAEGRRALAALQRADRQRALHLQQLEALSEQLMTTEAQTREQLATRLHDGLSQSLYAAHLQLDLAVRQANQGPPRDAQPLGEARRLLRDAMNDARALTTALHPPTLQDLGLGEALRAAIPDWQRTYRCRITFCDHPHWQQVPEAVREPLYASLRELVINAAKHANATTITLQASPSEPSTPTDTRTTRPAPQTLGFSVEDNGQGFDTTAPRKGFGLLSIERRLHHLGGQFTLEPTPTGTRATLRIPTIRSPG